MLQELPKLRAEYNLLRLRSPAQDSQQWKMIDGAVKNSQSSLKVEVNIQRMQVDHLPRVCKQKGFLTDSVCPYYTHEKTFPGAH